MKKWGESARIIARKSNLSRETRLWRYNMKKLSRLIAFVILVTLVILLKKEYDRRSLPEKYKIYLEDLEAKVDNITPASDKITKTYECDFLLGTIDYLMENAPPECVRYNNGVYYFVYKTEKGYYFISPNYRRLGDNWMFVDKLYVDDFDIIKKNETTIEDIKKIDKYANYISYSGVPKPPYSVHFTVDGYKIVIKYAKKSCRSGNYFGI